MYKRTRENIFKKREKKQNIKKIQEMKWNEMNLKIEREKKNS